MIHAAAIAEPSSPATASSLGPGFGIGHAVAVHGLLAASLGIGGGWFDMSIPAIALRRVDPLAPVAPGAWVAPPGAASDASASPMTARPASVTIR
jgi:hypothetical protein